MGENKSGKKIATVVLRLEVEMDWEEGEFSDLQLNAFDFQIENPNIHQIFDLAVEEIIPQGG